LKSVGEPAHRRRPTHSRDDAVPGLQEGGKRGSAYRRFRWMRLTAWIPNREFYASGFAAGRFRQAGESEASGGLESFDDAALFDEGLDGFMSAVYHRHGPLEFKIERIFFSQGLSNVFKECLSAGPVVGDFA